ncbi:hypothetical protein ACH4SP_00125 [Streptomyces sp. NPDC021093]|uniref:hypothetical protein n=1 Tax=Streptomyces sp. NPDC021093 TaxID=3365112 RepID=UPI0037A9FD4D
MSTRRDAAEPRPEPAVRPGHDAEGPVPGQVPPAGPDAATATPASPAHSFARVAVTADAGPDSRAQEDLEAERPAQPEPATPRRDFVFIMGKDRAPTARNRTPEQFYTAAEHFYRARRPTATFVTDLRTLADLLSWVAVNVKEPIGNLVIVSHANEDGTLSFALNPGDSDGRTSAAELRAALHPAGGQQPLADVRGVVDSRTSISIKGCDLGRTQAMVELVDEAFGGAGTVTAPTHEQVYSFRQRRGGAKDPKGSPAVHESFSGPMFQRPGHRLFTTAELRPQVDALYGHLPDARRADLTARLAARDRRSEAQAGKDGLRGQQGQRVFRLAYSEVVRDPASPEEAQQLYRAPFREGRFRANAVSVQRELADGVLHFTVTVTGTAAGPDGKRQPDTRQYVEEHSDDEQLLGKLRSQLGNPERYSWRVDETHRTDGTTLRRAVAVRVVAYLHHGSLDRSATEPFIRPESDPAFFATSTYEAPDGP